MFQSPKLFLNFILIGCCCKRMRKEWGCPTANQSASYESRSHALQFSKHGRKLRQKAQCFTADSFYQYLSLLMMGQPRKTRADRPKKRGWNGNQHTGPVKRRRRWLKTSCQLTMKHRLRRSTLVTKVSNYHQNCHRGFHPIQIYIYIFIYFLAMPCYSTYIAAHAHQI